MLSSNSGIIIFKQVANKSYTSEVTQSCLTLCDPMDCSLPCSSIHGIFQARVLEWIAISFSRGPSWPRDRTRVFCIVGRRFTVWATREVLHNFSILCVHPPIVDFAMHASLTWCAWKKPKCYLKVYAFLFLFSWKLYLQIGW